MVAAPIQKGRVPEVRELLSTLNFAPGVVNPNNLLVPFAEFNELHFARFVILDDQTLGDSALYGMETANLRVHLAFIGDFDGDYNAFIQHLAKRAEQGLRQIFSHCEGFSAQPDLAAWLKTNEYRAFTYYCNWVGRTVLQSRQEQQLRLALREHIDRTPALPDLPAREIHARLVEFVRSERNAGRLELTPEPKTPSAVLLKRAGDIFASIALAITIPLTIIPALVMALFLRMREKSDPEFAPRPDEEWARQLALIEDHNVTNQFTAMGSVKPGIFRRLLLRLILWIINLTAGLIYTKGRLARVHTIHFARWTYIDQGKRLVFVSNYDGSLESYMDDFINKVAFGLNAVFSNGIGYPKTRWLVLDGAKNEQLFKYYIRRHQLPSQVWYNALAGLTAFDLARNSQIRQGLEAANMNEDAIREWLALL